MNSYVIVKSKAVILPMLKRKLQCLKEKPGHLKIQKQNTEGKLFFLDSVQVFVPKF